MARLFFNFFLLLFYLSYYLFFLENSHHQGQVRSTTWLRARPSNRERSMKMKSKLVVLLYLLSISLRFRSMTSLNDRFSRSIIDLFSFSWRRFSVDDAPSVSRAELWSGWATVVPARRWEIPATPPGISALSASAPGCSSSPRPPGTRFRCDRASRTTLRSVLPPPDDADLSWTSKF